MSTRPERFINLLRRDPRYKPEAYEFVRVALSYAQNVLDMGAPTPTELEQIEVEQQEDQPPIEPHLTGQQLCEGIRRYAIEQYGYMAKIVLGNWGIHSTSDFGEIVYNLIGIGEMKKSKSDRREDFDDVYDFDEAFERNFEITMPE